MLFPFKFLIHLFSLRQKNQDSVSSAWLRVIPIKKALRLSSVEFRQGVRIYCGLGPSGLPAGYRCNVVLMTCLCRKHCRVVICEIASLAMMHWSMTSSSGCGVVKSTSGKKCLVCVMEESALICGSEMIALLIGVMSQLRIQAVRPIFLRQLCELALRCHVPRQASLASGPSSRPVVLQCSLWRLRQRAGWESSWPSS